MRKHIEPVHSLQVKPTEVYTCVLKRPASKVIGGVRFVDSIAHAVAGTTAKGVAARAQVYILPFTPNIKVEWTKGVEHPPELFVEVATSRRKSRRKG